MTESLRLDRDAIHLARSAALPLREFEHDYDRYIAVHCSEGEPGRLLAMATTNEDWPTWEVHPAGDEVVVLVSGKAEFLQDFGETLRRTVVAAGGALINPAGVPHTANVLEPFTAIYVTPCPGTQHLPRTRDRE